MWVADENGLAVWIAGSIEDTAPCEYSPPIEEVFSKPESEKEKIERMWEAVKAASQS